MSSSKCENQKMSKKEGTEMKDAMVNLRDINTNSTFKGNGTGTGCSKPLKPTSSSLSESQQSWLQDEGLKIKPMPRNSESSSSLFRAIAEEIFLTQANHEKVKNQVLQFLTEKFPVMEQRVRLAYGREMAMKPIYQLERDVHELGSTFGKEPVTPWHAYMYRLTHGTNVAGFVEIGAMSELYKRKILVYRAIPSAPLVFGGSETRSTPIKLLNFYGSNHYDLLVSANSIQSAAMCQSVVYEMLYEKVFGLQNTITTSEIALGKSSLATKEDEDETLKSSSRFDKNEPDALNHIKHKFLPFPLKIAKSLDPASYRDSQRDGN